MDTDIGLFRPYAIGNYEGAIYMLDYFVIRTISLTGRPITTLVGVLVKDVNLPDELLVSGSTSH